MSDTRSGAVVHQRQGKAWSVEEDRQLYDGFVSGQAIDTLASAHERSAGGIRARLGRLGLIDQNGEMVQPTPPFAVPRRRRTPTAGISSEMEEDSVQSVFGMRTGDGWIVEIKSNRPLSKPLVERLTSMLHGVVGEGEGQ
jgi:hypothetical protein